MIVIFKHFIVTKMELQGNGFLLRAWQPGDEASLQKHADNPKVSAFLRDRFPYPYTMEDALFSGEPCSKSATFNQLCHSS
ncbi:hypothetical protein ACFJIV_28180 [Mucilaginibacter sp. UC70_90]